MTSKHFIFDFDGVMYDQGSHFSIQRLIDNARTAGAKAPSKKFMIEIWGIGIQEIAQAAAIKYKWSAEQERLFLFHELQDRRVAPPIPGLIPMLEGLVQLGHRMSIVSNRRINTMYEVMKAIGLDHKIFNSIHALNPDGSGLQKPNPAIFNSLIKFMHPPINGLTKKDTVFIGDTIDYDYQFAKNLQVNFIAITSALNNKQDFIKVGVPPEMILKSVVELPQIIKFL